jgi:predicted DNA-binding antitoxin AbrB/MazE fold protein
MEINGHYENGVIIPDNDISWPDGTKVTISVRAANARNDRDKMSDEERHRYLEALARIDAVPDENPSDTFSGADHDRALYGDQP